MTAPKCTSWLGHKFVARYSTKPGKLTPAQLKELFWLGTLERKYAMSSERIYECDVCVRCGHVIDHVVNVKAE